MKNNKKSGRRRTQPLWVIASLVILSAGFLAFGPTLFASPNSIGTTTPVFAPEAVMAAADMAAKPFSCHLVLMLGYHSTSCLAVRS
ncbi:MAG: hypothetical protein IPP40_15500 [bacterium]|nr:hypothetical protein [bacterium]